MDGFHHHHHHHHHHQLHHHHHHHNHHHHHQMMCLTAAPITPITGFTGKWYLGQLPCYIMPACTVTILCLLTFIQVFLYKIHRHIFLGCLGIHIDIQYDCHSFIQVRMVYHLHCYKALSYSLCLNIVNDNKSRCNKFQLVLILIR